MTSTALGYLRDGQYKHVIGTTGEFSAYNEVLKRFYEGPLRDILNSVRVAVRLFNREVQGVSVSGSTMTTAIRYKRNAGIKSVREGTRMPTAGKQGVKQAQFATRWVFGAAQFTGQFISAARNDRGSFINGMDLELNGLGEDAQHSIQRQMYSDGSGRLARVAAVSTTTLTLDAPGGNIGQGLGTQYLGEGDRVSIMKSGSESKQAYTTVPGDWNGDAGSLFRSFEVLPTIDYANGTIQLASLAGGAALDMTGVGVGDWLYVAREPGIAFASFLDADAARAQDLNGLMAIVSDANPSLQRPGFEADPYQGFGNIGIATIPRWKATVRGNVGGPVPFSQSMIDDAKNDLAIAGNGVIQVLLTTHGVRSQFATELIADRQYPPTMEIEGGWRAVSHAGVPMLVDKDCPRGTIFGLDLSTIGCIKEADWSFVDDNGIVLQKVPGFWAYIVEIVLGAQMVCSERNRNFRIDDILDT